MSDDATFWADVWRNVSNNTEIAAALLGGLGGVTSSLAVSGTTRKKFVRHIAVGALFAYGAGPLAISVVTTVMGLDSDTIPPFAASSASYLAGVFAPAMIEAFIARMKAPATTGGDGNEG